ncbi:MAG: hypothetical protein A2402_01955 [Candidatus Staskawiczbacteria bacterium RIFOXYC1_FULL_37_43]|nr:MAG: hypothetical protein A2813_00310 [Candidatus Staskawiczbacteria bacterium RIFCSPHIGHO2_01_FULL_37_17]OGZ71391.1 MAG: hypothetical protein A2891_02295 [Candidatus Staskawiczbacteria bacterium RIFCSPLOWO2_01_FULL_37_19]OGZ77736.1 MAG: hypothetical protein A2280_00840 [Candidatus Staskawiczbacteria bacterium RIFOXYA12_FULL_37_10]OGZ80784.1 MAG: hypothetical protein A2353_00905 [Candidatus Staskawiczbacteria bacterium RIFOXYB1_FULL_38_37]OGZ81590.1 MAG: hypothetical protein A2402_01955 [Can
MNDDFSDYLDKQSSRNQRRLNKEIDAMLANDSRWQAPDWRAKHRRQYLSGFLAGVIIAIIVALLVHFVF